MNNLVFPAVLVIGFILTILGTPVTRKAAMHYNLLDFPDGKLKKQENPVPYMGGVIIYFSLITSVSIFSSFEKELLGILFSSSILLLVGLFDDLKAMKPGTKFLFQIVATYILIRSGILINLMFIPHWINIGLTTFMILTFINAFNIIDILDGLASSVAAVSCLTIFAIAFLSHDFMLAVLSSSLLGALLGFLRFNWEPARIYLGDAGSMILGLMTGSMAIMCSYTAYNELAFVSGFLILGIPLFDLVYVMFLRLEKGKSPFRGSPDHFALRLQKKFAWSVRKTVLALTGAQFLFSCLVVVNYFATPAFTIASSAVLLLILLISGWILAQVKME